MENVTMFYGDEKLPSVTTILSATQSPEKTASLRAWRERVGEAEATRIVDTAGARAEPQCTKF